MDWLKVLIGADSSYIDTINTGGSSRTSNCDVPFCPLTWLQIHTNRNTANRPIKIWLLPEIKAESGRRQTKSHFFPCPQKFPCHFFLEESIYLSTPISHCHWSLFFNWERKLALFLPTDDLKSHFPASVRSPVKQSTNTEARTLK